MRTTTVVSERAAGLGSGSSRKEAQELGGFAQGILGQGVLEAWVCLLLVHSPNLSRAELRYQPTRLPSRPLCTYHMEGLAQIYGPDGTHTHRGVPQSVQVRTWC